MKGRLRTLKVVINLMGFLGMTVAFSNRCHVKILHEDIEGALEIVT